MGISKIRMEKYANTILPLGSLCESEPRVCFITAVYKSNRLEDCGS